MTTIYPLSTPKTRVPVGPRHKTATSQVYLLWGLVLVARGLGDLGVQAQWDQGQWDPCQWWADLWDLVVRGCLVALWVGEWVEEVQTWRSFNDRRKVLIFLEVQPSQFTDKLAMRNFY